VENVVGLGGEYGFVGRGGGAGKLDEYETEVLVHSKREKRKSHFLSGFFL
jgi:hypothetical protein